jgi:hypothetical protein
MSALPLKTAISDIYPNPSNATARAGFAALWDAVNESLEKSELDLASAATCDIGGQLSTKLRITGTTTITSFGTNYRGPVLLRMSGIVTITHNATTLRCPGATNITTAAGDVLVAWPTATVSGTIDGWQVAILARGTGGATFPGAVAMSGAATVGTTLGVTGATTLTGLLEANGGANIAGKLGSATVAAGDIGENMDVNLVTGSAVSLVSGTAKTVVSRSLTAGKWEVGGVVNFNYGATTQILSLFGGSSLVDNAQDGYQFSHRCASFAPATAPMGYAIPPREIDIDTTTTVYLVATAGFTTSTCNAWGYMRIRRLA